VENFDPELPCVRTCSGPAESGILREGYSSPRRPQSMIPRSPIPSREVLGSILAQSSLLRPASGVGARPHLSCCADACRRPDPLHARCRRARHRELGGHVALGSKTSPSSSSSLNTIDSMFCHWRAAVQPHQSRIPSIYGPSRSRRHLADIFVTPRRSSGARAEVCYRV